MMEQEALLRLLVKKGIITAKKIYQGVGRGKHRDGRKAGE